MNCISEATRFFYFMQMIKEEWKVVEGFEDYEISNLGRVKSLKFGKEKILKYSNTFNNYNSIGLFKNKKSYRFNIHQLVAIAFLNHKPCGYEVVVDHINDDIKDNRVENLQLITQRDNTFKTQGKYTSKYKGVHFDKKINKFISMISLNGKRINLGCFKTEIEAHEVYQNKLKQI